MPDMTALELADRLNPDLPHVLRIDAEHAGEMLRRQHAEIQEWRNVFGFLGTPDELGNEWNALKEVNSRQHEAIVKLREALRGMVALEGEGLRGNDDIDICYEHREALQALKDTEELV